MLINDIYNLHDNHNNVKSVGNKVMSKFGVSILQTYGFGQEFSSIRFPIRILVAFFGKLYSNKICFWKNIKSDKLFYGVEVEHWYLLQKHH